MMATPVVPRLVDENPEKLRVQRRSSLAVHGRACGDSPGRGFPWCNFSHAGLPADVPHADSFAVGANAQAAHIDLKVRAYPNPPTRFPSSIPKIANPTARLG